MEMACMFHNCFCQWMFTASLKHVNRVMGNQRLPSYFFNNYKEEWGEEGVISFDT